MCIFINTNEYIYIYIYIYMCVYAWIHIYIYIYIYIYIWVLIERNRSVCGWLYLSLYIYIYIQMFRSTCIYIYIYIYNHIYAYTYAHACLYTHIYTHTHIYMYIVICTWDLTTLHNIFSKTVIMLLWNRNVITSTCFHKISSLQIILFFNIFLRIVGWFSIIYFHICKSLSFFLSFSLSLHI